MFLFLFLYYFLLIYYFNYNNFLFILVGFYPYFLKKSNEIIHRFHDKLNVFSNYQPSTKYRNVLTSYCTIEPYYISSYLNKSNKPTNLKNSNKISDSNKFTKYSYPNFTHRCYLHKGFINFKDFLINYKQKNKLKVYAIKKLYKSIIHKDLIQDVERLEKSKPELYDESDEEEFDNDEYVEQGYVPIAPLKSQELDENGDVESESVNKKATRLWNKYKHLFKPLETLEEKTSRILKIPLTRINVEGVDVDVRIGTLGLPWYIDQENKKKLESTYDPDALEYIKTQESYKYSNYPLIKDEEQQDWVPLPGIAATYFPNVKVLDHKTNIPDYDYVTLLEDTGRKYTWTYQQSSRKRASSFDGEGELDTYKVVDDKIVPNEKKSKETYKLYVPKDYFNIPKDPRETFPKKTLDIGIFRQPKMEDVLRMKYKNLDPDVEDKEQYGYCRDEQNFWKTVDYRDNGDKPGMVYRELGTSGLRVSQVGLGTMMFGSFTSELEANALLDYAFDKFGVNFFDTCELYPIPFSYRTFGESERILGRWIKKRGPEFRSKIVVSSRICCRNDNLKLTRESKDTSLSKKNIINAVNSSLERLGLEYIDLVQFSWPDRYVPMQETGDYKQMFFDLESMYNYQPVPMEEQIEAIGELFKEGKIKAWGLSNETPWGALRMYHLAKEINVPPPVSVQLNYNLLSRNEVEKGFVELARPQNTGMGIIAYGPLAGGILTGKYLEYIEATTLARLLRFPSYMKRYRGSLAAKAVQEYYETAMDFKLPNLTVMSLKWVYTRPFIFSTIIGASDMYQLRENLYCLDPELPMTDLMERRINQIHWKWRDPIRIVQ